MILLSKADLLALVLGETIEANNPDEYGTTKIRADDNAGSEFIKELGKEAAALINERKKDEHG